MNREIVVSSDRERKEKSEREKVSSTVGLGWNFVKRFLIRGISIWSFISFRSSLSMRNLSHTAQQCFQRFFRTKTFRVAFDASSTVGSGCNFVSRFIIRGASIWLFGLLTYRLRTVVAVLWILVSCSLFHLYCLAIWLIIEHNLCCDLTLSCNLNFDHNGAWLTDLCMWFLLLTLIRFFTLKFLCLPSVCFCCCHYLLLFLTDSCKLDKILSITYWSCLVIILLCWIFNREVPKKMFHI